MLIPQGTDVVTVSKMLGHAKVSTTEDIYSHVIEESKQQASNALAEVYFRRKAAENCLSCGNSSADSDHGGNVYTGTLFLPVSLPHGSSICNDAGYSGSTF